MVNYSKTIMYKIVCKDLAVKHGYVGGTTDIVSRRHQHKSNCYNTNNMKKYNRLIYRTIRDNGGWDNWQMIKIEDFPLCKSGTESRMRERALYEQLFEEKLNMNRPFSTDEEKAEQIFNSSIIHNAKRDTTIKQCNCGGTFNYTNKARHLNTKTHRKYLQDNPTN